MIVGAGPAGLECARALGQRGYAVTLAEVSTELGGRVTAEARLPGLAEWGRVRDYRVGQITAMSNVETFLDSRMTATQVIEFGANHVVVATGSRWRSDGVGRQNHAPIEGSQETAVFTPDHIMAGSPLPHGPVLVFDDDHFYMGGILCEKLRAEDRDVILVTPAADVSHWTHYTMEQTHIQKRLIELGVEILPYHNLVAIRPGEAQLACTFTDRRQARACGSVVMVTARLPQDGLYHDLMKDGEGLAEAGVKSLTRVGDCLAPGTIAAAVYGGHRYARELDEPVPAGVPFRRELPELAAS